MASSPGCIRQAAAIPVRDGRICLVTSSSGKRWVIPKGCMEPGMTAGEVALEEAWEEAGLVGVLQPDPVGSYLYQKYGNEYLVIVFRLQVTEATDDWPERSFRQRSWLTPAEALERIDDRGLRVLIRATAEEYAEAEG
jgi:8-oxo-dGTP pyrophosphatase MutT (NUDIX family)